VSETPPWRVDAWDLSGDLAKIEQQWTPVHEILADTALYELRAPSVSEWSCGEHAGHILLAARSMASSIEGNLAEPERDRDGAQADFTKQLFEAGTFPRGRAQAPERLIPLGHDRAEFEAMLPTVADAWQAIASRAAELATCSARTPHFVFGYLTCPEWVRMCAVHTAHHLAIVRDMREVRES